MRQADNQLRLSATDLANHLGCRHLTALDIQASYGQLAPPVWRDPILEVLQERGFRHENEYLEHLRREGLSVLRLEEIEQRSPVLRTIQAMRQGPDVIVQAYLGLDRWRGRADILLKVNRSSDLGDWSYEVIDTKLAQETRAGTILQLCLYSNIVGEFQGTRPEFMHVVAPGHDFQPETFRVDDFVAYYRLVQQNLVGAADSYSSDSPGTYPEPVPQCDICRWWSHCDRRWREDDHLSLVAGLSKLQANELRARGIGTLEALARLEMPLEPRPRRGAPDGYLRVREQARIQLEGRERQEPVYELLPSEQGQGFHWATYDR